MLDVQLQSIFESTRGRQRIGFSSCTTAAQQLHKAVELGRFININRITVADAISPDTSFNTRETRLNIHVPCLGNSPRAYALIAEVK